MKIAWLINIVMPEVAEELGIWKTTLGGWIVGQINELKKTKNELVVISVSQDVAKVQKIYKDNIIYYVLPYEEKSKIYERLTALMEEIKPDVFHIFGTETDVASIAFQTVQPEKTVISIQGLVSIIAKHMGNGIPEQYYKSNFWKRIGKNIFNGSIIEDNEVRLTKKGEMEIALIKRAHHIIGRTTWDKACIDQINMNANYYSCNEILRAPFYYNKWNVDECQRHTIFLSQSASPIKGLHQVIKALPLILKQFPDTQVYIAGEPLSDFPKRNNLKQLIVEYFCGYQGYIEKLVRESSVSEHIHFLNYLDEEKMVEQYLKANVFVLPSSIENSPNSLGEAMLLGVPCIAACVGGVQDMLYEPEEGFIYPFDEPYMLAWYVCKIFESDELAKKISRNARCHAVKTHERDNNTKNLIEIYTRILEKK